MRSVGCFKKSGCFGVFATVLLLLQPTVFVVVVEGSSSSSLAIGYGYDTTTTSSTSSNLGGGPRGLFPQTLRDAVQAGWEKSALHDDNNLYGHPDLPNYKLLYGNTAWLPSATSELSALVVTMDPIYDDKDGTATPAPGAVLVTATTASNNTTTTTTTADTATEMEYRIQLDRGGGVTVGDLVVPATYQEAEELGWTETGCVETMGGAHYVPPENVLIPYLGTRRQRYAFSAVYDKYTPGSGGILSALRLAAGLSPAEEEAMQQLDSTTQVDSSSFQQQWSDLDNHGIAVLQDTACKVHCGHPGCHNMPGKYARTAHIHLRGNDDGMNATAGTMQQAANKVQCQGGPNVQCYSGPCSSCCGVGVGSTKADPFQQPPQDWCLPPDDHEQQQQQQQQHTQNFITMGDCMEGIKALDFQLKDFERYDQFFREDSVLTLPPAGAYKGVEDIEEYVRFASDTSPYLKVDGTVRVKIVFSSVNQEEGTCEFLVYRVGWYISEPQYAREARFLTATMMKGTYDYYEHYLPKVGLYLTPEWLNYVFGTILYTPQTKKFICDVSDKCPDTNVGISHQECVAKLEELPLFSDQFHFDGKDYSCRSLHATFADINPTHCAHLSFEPQEDPLGRIKCQTSANISYDDIFSPDELDGFYDYVVSKESLIESRDGFVIKDMPKERDNTKLVVLGFILPAIIMMVVFSSLSYKSYSKVNEEEEEDKDEAKEGAGDNDNKKKDGEVALFANKHRQLWILVGVAITSYILAYGISISIVLAISQQNPEWTADYDDDNVLVGGSWITNPGPVQDSAPQSILDYKEFLVYTGFVVWVVVVTAGLGLELFVWYHFLQFWSPEREGLWKFAQFIFPVMSTTALGLALHQNYLALPVMIIGFWKLGFPETLMYMYLGCFGKATRLSRLSDFLNGLGTLIHHSAASFIVVMLVVGVLPASRYILNPCLILVLQHWVVLLVYASPPLYCAIELGLEYYFNLIVFSDFVQLLHLHWTAAVGATVMLFAHWLYLAGALTSICVSGDVDENIHTRGNTEMDITVVTKQGGNQLTKIRSERRRSSMQSTSTLGQRWHDLRMVSQAGKTKLRRNTSGGTTSESLANVFFEVLTRELEEEEGVVLGAEEHMSLIDESEEEHYLVSTR